MCEDAPKDFSPQNKTPEIGRPRLLSIEAAVKAYSENGSISKAAVAIGFSYGAVRARLLEAGVLKKQGRPTIGESAMTQTQRNKKRKPKK